MADTELSDKQRALLGALETSERLNKDIVQRQGELKERLQKLAKLHRAVSSSEQRKQIEDFMKRVQVQQKQIGAMRRSHSVTNHKVQAIFNRDKKDTAAFGRLLDRANESMDRYTKAATLHLKTLDELIAEADVLLGLGSAGS